MQETARPSGIQDGADLPNVDRLAAEQQSIQRTEERRIFLRQLIEQRCRQEQDIEFA